MNCCVVFSAYIPRLYLRISSYPFVSVSEYILHICICTFLFTHCIHVCIRGFILCVCICAFVSARLYLRLVFTRLMYLWIHITRWFYSYDVSMFCIRSRTTLYSYILITSANFKWRDLAIENSRLGHALRQISDQKLAFSSIK